MKSLVEVENIVGLKRRAIQEYEDAGLANKPKQKNNYGYLLYDTPEIERLWQLKFYKELGYNITKIKSIQAKGKIAEKEDLTNVISELKKKRDNLNNIIAIAEAMDEVKCSFNDIKTIFTPIDEFQAENLFEILGAVLTLLKFEITEDSFVENVITDNDWELIFSYVKRIQDSFHNNYKYTDNIVQTEIINIHKVISKAFSESIYILRSIINSVALNEEIKEDFGVEMSEYMICAFKHYCDENILNSTDKMLQDVFVEIEKLRRSKHTANCKEVQNEVKNIYEFFDEIKIFKSEVKKNWVKKIGELFGSQAYKNIIDNGKPKGIAWFISRAIETYIDTMERGKLNG